MWSAADLFTLSLEGPPLLRTIPVTKTNARARTLKNLNPTKFSRFASPKRKTNN
jgi:hypothetical protein